jgi:ferredoxin
MFYLPRTRNHCLNPACVAACPSGALYKRGEDGVVLVDQNRCRGWRACVPACPYKKIYSAVARHGPRHNLDRRVGRPLFTNDNDAVEDVVPRGSDERGSHEARRNRAKLAEIVLRHIAQILVRSGESLRFERRRGRIGQLRRRLTSPRESSGVRGHPQGKKMFAVLARYEGAERARTLPPGNEAQITCRVHGRRPDNDLAAGRQACHQKLEIVEHRRVARVELLRVDGSAGIDRKIACEPPGNAVGHRKIRRVAARQLRPDPIETVEDTRPIVDAVRRIGGVLPLGMFTERREALRFCFALERPDEIDGHRTLSVGAPADLIVETADHETPVIRAIGQERGQRRNIGVVPQQPDSRHECRCFDGSARAEVGFNFQEIVDAALEEHRVDVTPFDDRAHQFCLEPHRYAEAVGWRLAEQDNLSITGVVQESLG